MSKFGRLKKGPPSKTPKVFMEPVSAEHSDTGCDELYMVMDGKRVAYRGHPGTDEAGTWVSLDPNIIGVFDTAEEGHRALAAHGIFGAPMEDGGKIELFPEPKGSAQ
jgi:hypothetical protein